MTKKDTEPLPEPEPLNTDALTAAVANLRAVMDNAKTFHRPAMLLLEEIEQAVKGIEDAVKPAAE